MKTRTLVSILIPVLVVAISFIYTSCASDGVTPSFVGTWVNSDYDGVYPLGPGAKAVITDNGDGTYTNKIYVNVSDTEPAETQTATVTEEWTDSEGNLFMKAVVSTTGGPLYCLCKVHADNKTYEGQADTDDYPTVLNPLDPNYYAIYSRQ